MQGLLASYGQSQMPVTTSLPLRDPLPGPGLFEFCIDSISIHIKGLTSAGPDHKTQLCGLQWAYTTHDSCPRTYSFLETMTPSAFGCMRLRQLDSSVPPPRCEMTHEWPMQGFVPRTVLLNNNNTAVPNPLSPNVDHDKDVTSRHGFTAMVSQLESSRVLSVGGKGCVLRSRHAKARDSLEVPFDRKSVFTFARTPAQRLHSTPLQGSV
jgi:hypothetical protein